MYLSIQLYQLLNTSNNCPWCDLSSHMFMNQYQVIRSRGLIHHQ